MAPAPGNQREGRLVFHLSLPVQRFSACLLFYARFFDARVESLSPTAANIFVLGGQLTLHDRSDSPLTASARGAMHFGAVISKAEWIRLRRTLALNGLPFIVDNAPGGIGIRGKVQIVDPSGNIIEINCD